MMPRGGAKPKSRRGELSARLGKQMDKLKNIERENAKAQALLDDWEENAWEYLQDVCNVAYPAETPQDPTSAGLVLGRLQGFLWPMRTALDLQGMYEQAKANLDKTRDQLNGLEEEEDDV